VGAYSAPPDPLAGFKGPTYKEGEGRVGREVEGEGEEGEERGGEGTRTSPSHMSGCGAVIVWFWTSMKRATTNLPVELWARGSSSVVTKQLRRLF